MYVTYDITLTVEVSGDLDGWVSSATLDRLENAVASVLEWSTAREAIETGLDGSMGEQVSVDEFRLVGRCMIDDPD